MNENPEGNLAGTPNPLNPNPTPPVAEPTPVETAVETEVITVAETPIATSEPTVTPEPAPVVTPELEPRDSIVEPVKKKSKVGLFIAILLLIAAVGAAVAALIIVKPFQKTDRVPAAIAKLFSNDFSKKISLKGSITLENFDGVAAATNQVVNFDSGINLETGENFVKAQVAATLADESEFAFDVDEIHTKDGNLYLRLNGISEALNNYKPVDKVYDDAVEEGIVNTVDGDAVGEDIAKNDCENDTSCIAQDPTETILGSLGVFEVIDNEWILIPDSSFSNVTDIFDVDAPVQCVIDAAGNLSEYGKDFVQKYNENQFITYSTDSLSIAKKANTLYKLSFDNEKLMAFINSMSNSGFANSLLACTGEAATTKNITLDQVAKITNYLKDFYVEIDDNNNFTRVYFTVTSETPEGAIGASSLELTVDITIGYPATITIDEPEQYLDYNTLLMNLMTQFYKTPLADEAE